MENTTQQPSLISMGKFIQLKWENLLGRYPELTLCISGFSIWLSFYHPQSMYSEETEMPV